MRCARGVVVEIDGGSDVRRAACRREARAWPEVSMPRCRRFALPIAWITALAAMSSCDPPGAPPAVSIAAAQVTADGWFFRGTPNSWGTTAMTMVTATTFTTCQTFANVAN